LRDGRQYYSTHLSISSLTIETLERETLPPRLLAPSSFALPLPRLVSPLTRSCGGTHTSDHSEQRQREGGALRTRERQGRQGLRKQKRQAVGGGQDLPKSKHARMDDDVTGFLGTTPPSAGSRIASAREPYNGMNSPIFTQLIPRTITLGSVLHNIYMRHVALSIVTSPRKVQTHSRIAYAYNPTSPSKYQLSFSYPSPVTFNHFPPTIFFP
jgi:hypothetical protein